MNQLFEFRQGVLLAEFNNLQQSIRHYDNILYLIKGWSITVFGGIVGFGLQQSRHNVVLFALLVILMFWLIETHAKVVQRLFIARYNKVEHFLRHKSQLETAWAKETFSDLNFPDFTARYSVKDIKLKAGFSQCAFTPYTSVLYIMQIIIGLSVYSGLYFKLL